MSPRLLDLLYRSQGLEKFFNEHTSTLERVVLNPAVHFRLVLSISFIGQFRLFLSLFCIVQFLLSLSISCIVDFFVLAFIVETRMTAGPKALQGYLAQKKTPTPLGSP